MIFLRKVEPGKADRSYGIEVARLAGLPLEVVQRARAVLARHEEKEHSVSEELSSEASPAPRKHRSSLTPPSTASPKSCKRSTSTRSARSKP